MGEAPDAKIPGAPVGVDSGAEVTDDSEAALVAEDAAREEVAGEAVGETVLGEEPEEPDGPGPGPPVQAA